VFPVRYELHFYIAFRRNSVFKVLRTVKRSLVKTISCPSHVPRKLNLSPVNRKSKESIVL
jgi:hypothetical protein